MRAALTPARDRTITPSGHATAVIPVSGIVAPRMNMFSDISGGTTFEGLTTDLQDAVADPQIGTIVLDVDSPGGNVAGATEFHKAMLAARTKKPIIGQVQYLGASVAYWILSACTEIVAAPSAMVGAIGVYTMYDDLSKALSNRGIKREVIAAGKFKDEGVDSGPLSPEARAHLRVTGGRELYAVRDRYLPRARAPRGRGAQWLRGGTTPLRGDGTECGHDRSHRTDE